VNYSGEQLRSPALRAAIASLIALVSCDVDGTVPNDAAIERVARLGRTTDLVCAGDDVTNEGLRTLDGSDVRSVWFRACGRVDGSTFDVLGRMPQLEEVSVWNCPVRSDIAFDFLRETDSVKELILVKLHLEDPAFADIAAGKSLGILRLYELEGLTDKGVEQLAASKSLREIHVNECPAVTENAILRLKTALPSCLITYD
jgi:hypothetical protein